MVSDEADPIVPAPTSSPRRFVIRALARAVLLVVFLTVVFLTVLLLACAFWLIGLALLEAMNLGWVISTNGLRLANLVFTIGSSLFGVVGAILTINGARVLAWSRAAPVVPGADLPKRPSQRVINAATLAEAVGLAALSFLVAVQLARTEPVDANTYTWVMLAISFLLVMLSVTNLLAWRAVFARRMPRNAATTR